MINRYLINFNVHNLTVRRTDILIMGAGIAGLNTALNLESGWEITVLTKGSGEECNTEYAQGGIAASLGGNDTQKLHAEDTIEAGAGLCNREAVNILAANASDCIMDLLARGVNFDYQGQQPALTREGGHSRRRILHAKDATGQEIRSTLFDLAVEKDNINFQADKFVLDLLTDKQQCVGAVVYDCKLEEVVVYQALQVVIAAGGAGRLYQATSNPSLATGDGIAAAYRAGAEIMDLEFMQFHPTTLYQEAGENFLISEAVRGEGGILRNQAGERFMPDYHPQAELAPRDIVARAIYREQQKQTQDWVYLDITELETEFIKDRFPTIYQRCQAAGLEITEELIPVTPAAHYLMGGIKTDTTGATNLDGLFACGEAACLGLHGANRLASNSLLDGLVYGQRVAEKINHSKQIRSFTFQQQKSYCQQLTNKEVELEIKSKLQAVMNKQVGIVRSRQGLIAAKEQLQKWLPYLKLEFERPAAWETQNLLTIAYLTVKAALKRRESRGAHYRRDYPDSKPDWQQHIIWQHSQEEEEFRFGVK